MNNKRVISFVLVFFMLFSMMPIQSFAEVIGNDLQNEELLKEELRKAVDETQYPNGLFEFLATRMNTSENLSSVEFAIVRKGGTTGKASVTFKAIDVSAKYGEDYTISIPKVIFSQTLPENEEAKPLIQSFESINDGVYSSVYSNTGEGGQEISVGDAVYYNNNGAEYSELPVSQPKEYSGLRAARDAFAGETSERRTWREVDQASKANALDLHNELYEDVPGVTYTFNFEDGEYIKKLRFNTIDDTISEDEEQVLFALLDPKGGALGESVNGFMNIEDNEKKEKVEFEIMEEQLSVERLSGYAEVTVKRTAGLYRYGLIQIGTAALTAQPELDYKPIAAELRFVPGQETQKVRVPLLEGEDGVKLQFLIKLDPGSANLSSSEKTQTIVTIEAKPRYLMQAEDSNVRMQSQLSTGTNFTTEDFNGKTYRVKTLTVDDIAEGQYENSNGWAKLSYTGSLDPHGNNRKQWIRFDQDLSMVELIRFQWYGDSEYIGPPPKTPSPSWSWVDDDEKNYTNGSSSHMFIGSQEKNWISRYDPWEEGAYGTVSQRQDFDLNWYYHYLYPYQKKENKINFGLLGDNIYDDVVQMLYVGQVKLYYPTTNFTIKTLIDDADAKITPKIWTSASNTQDDKTAFIGTLAFADDFNAVSKAYCYQDTITLVPKFADSNIDNSKVYLWGYKIQRKYGDGFYYVKGDQLNVHQLQTGTLRGTLKDYTGKIIGDVNGKIPLNMVSFANDTIVLMPVFKARNAFVEINYDENKGGMAQNSFSNGQTLKIGMLDTVKFNAFANTGYFVSGYEHGHTNNPIAYNENTIPSYEDERWLEEKDAEYGKKITDNKNYLLNFTPINGININPALPNELDFKPQKTYSKLTTKYSSPELKVKVDPKSADKNKGSVAYFPKEGAPQVGNSDNPMIISPIDRNKAYTLSGSPDEGYRMIWKDWSGDTDEDGILSETEADRIKEYEHLFDRKAVNGSFYNYVTNYDRPLIYYSFEPKPSGGDPGLIIGKVYIKGGNILENTGMQAANTTERALPGVPIIVNGHSISTNEKGTFEIEHSDFTTNEYHTIVINYNGFNYAGYVNVNAFTKITIEEYDSFIPYNFEIFDGDTRIDPKKIDNRDSEFTFRFEVKAKKPGISAQKALIRIYSKDGVQKGTAIEVSPQDGVFSFGFNPAAYGVVPGDSMTVQLVDQNGIEYLEHNVGFIFKKYLSTFSLLSSFKTPVQPVVDMIGTVDAAFDLGLAGKVNEYMVKNDKEWIISFGFSKDWEKSLEDGSDVEDENGSEEPAEEKLKDTAKDGTEAKIDDTVDKAVDTDSGRKKNSASVTTDMKFGISTSLYLRMIVDEDPESKGYGDAYFNEMIISTTLSGSYGKKVEILTPIGVTVFAAFELSGDITGMMYIEQFDNKKFYFNDEGEIDFSRSSMDDPNRDFTIYGRLIVKPRINISVGAKISGATLTVEGGAEFNLNFTTTGSGSGKVILDSKITLEVLFFTYEWKIARKEWSLFNYRQFSSFNSDSLFNDTNYLYESAENYKVMAGDYSKNRGGWQGDKTSQLMSSLAYEMTPANEQTLQTGIYPHPYTLLATIGENQQLLVFLDVNMNQDERNRIQLYYSIYDGTTWSEPQKVDSDNTQDSLPWLCDLGDKVLVAWSSSVSAATRDDTVMEVLNSRNIKARFFDKAGKTFGEVQEVTQETEQDIYSDTEPYIAYWKDEMGKEDLMIVYTKNEYKASGSNDDQDAVIGDIVNPNYSTLAYRFYDFDSNTWDLSSDLLNGYYGQGFISVSDYVYADESNILISGDNFWDGYWSRVPTGDEVGIKSLPNNDCLIAESDAIGYDGYAILAYALDMDENLSTTKDRELFIQLYSFEDEYFYPPIRCTDDSTGQYNLLFEESNDSVYLYYITDGDIMAMDVGYLLKKGLLKYNINEKPVFVLNKLQGVYSKPETVVHHKYDIRIDEHGNEIKENEMPIDEFMIKADDRNAYIVWGENDITYNDGIDPYSEEAALPENYHSEHHIYAARQIIGDETTRQILKDGITPLTYPTNDKYGNAIDYTQVEDVNHEVGKVQAGDPIIYKSKPTVWSDPVKLTDGKGANYNDLDFEILPDGSLRVVFVKGYSEVMDVAGKLMSIENVNNRSLMTADFDLNATNATVEIKPIHMPKPEGTIPVEINVQNLSLSALSDIVVEVNQVSYNTTDKVDEEVLDLRGGEEKNITLLWQVPENLEGTRLQVVVNNGDDTLCSTEQRIIEKSIIDISDAKSEFVDRNRLRITGTAVNNGNISAAGSEILAELSDYTIGSVSLGSLGVGETKKFEFYADIQPEMFKISVNNDGSVTEVMNLAVHSKSGTGISLSCRRYASSQDIEAIKNIRTFELKKFGDIIPASISLPKGSAIDLEPNFTYADDTLQKPRIIYVSSNEEVADFSSGYMKLLGKKIGTATITAYALPQINEIILSQNRFDRVDNLATIAEAAIKVKSFVVNVTEKPNDGINTPIVTNNTDTPKTVVIATGNDITVTTTAKAVTDSSGKTSAAVTPAQISEAVGKVLEESAKQGLTGNAVIVIKVEASSDAKSVETGIPGEAFKEIVNSSINAMTISSPIAIITFDDKTFDDLTSQAAEDIKIIVSKVDKSTLSDDVKQTVGEHPVFDFSVISGDRSISQFNGNVTVSVPYTPGDNEDINAIVIYYINDEGELELVCNSTYYPETGMVNFKTNHFSKYVVGYNEVTFMDVPENAWYSDAVGFIAARSITTGTGSSNYGPEDELTRGQYVVMLMRAYGIVPDQNPADNFIDAGNTYYTGYLAAAKRMGISNGIENNMFAPDNAITRQEMFTLLYNALKALDELPEGTTEKDMVEFSDAIDVAPWAKDAVALLVKAGVIRGSDGRLNPTADVNRAQMAQVLYNLLSK